MISSPVRRGRATVAAMALLALVGIGGSARANPPDVAQERAGSQSKQEVLQFWTERRMRRAETRTRTVSDGARPVSRATPEARAFAVDPSAPENWRHGKVFAKDRTGAYECSATAVGSQNRSVIFTAGHCVRYKGSWAKKLVFVPAYDRGQRPFGAWVWNVLRVPRQWASRENDNYDYAAVAMSRQNGVPLTDAVGAAGLAWNQPRDSQLSLFGYPFNFFDGQRMTGCVGTGFRGDDSGRGPATVGVSCDMGQGSSGGGWLIDGGYLNSVMSYGLTNRPDLSFGPYFTGAANGLLERAERD